MISTAIGQRPRHLMCWKRTIALALTFLLWSVSGDAQTTGMVQGKVVDEGGTPVEDATVVIEFKEMAGRKLQTETNDNGEYIQVGLQPGAYVVTASKDDVGSQTQEVTVRVGETAQMDFQLSETSGSATPPSPEAKEKAEKATTLFNEGVAASKAGDDDEAIQKFTETSELLPSCYECHFNIGLAYMRKEEPEQAEAAFKQAIEANPKKPEPYQQLAGLYSSENKHDQAAEMSAMAGKLGGKGATGGGGRADALFNQGVNLWNAGKIDEAIAVWEKATQANPKHAGAHYQLGLGYLNKGNMEDAKTALESYLELEPNGKYAEQAKGMLATMK